MQCPKGNTPLKSESCGKAAKLGSSSCQHTKLCTVGALREQHSRSLIVITQKWFITNDCWKFLLCTMPLSDLAEAKLLHCVHTAHTEAGILTQEYLSPDWYPPPLVQETPRQFPHTPEGTYPK